MSLLVTVRVQPGAQKSEILGTMADGSLKVRLKSPPEKGAANKELVMLLAGRFGVAKPAVKIVRGRASRIKLVSIEGVGHTKTAAPIKGV